MLRQSDMRAVGRDTENLTRQVTKAITVTWAPANLPLDSPTAIFY